MQKALSSCSLRRVWWLGSFVLIVFSSAGVANSEGKGKPGLKGGLGNSGGPLISGPAAAAPNSDPVVTEPIPEKTVSDNPVPVVEPPAPEAATMPATPARRHVGKIAKRPDSAETKSIRDELAREAAGSGDARGMLPTEKLENVLLSKLSPAFNALILSMISLIGDDAAPPENARDVSALAFTANLDGDTRLLRRQTTHFFTMLKLIEHLYAEEDRPVFRPDTEDDRIDSEAAFFAATEPATPHSSSAKDAIETFLANAMGFDRGVIKFDPVPVVPLSRDVFQTTEVLDTVSLLLRKRQYHAQQLIISATRDIASDVRNAALAPRILNRFLSSVIASMGNARDLARVSDLAADFLENPDAPLAHVNTPQTPETRNQMQAQYLRSGAHVLRAFDSIGADERWVVEKVVKPILRIEDIQDKMNLVKSIRDGLSGVIREICDVLSDLQNSPDLAFMKQDPELNFLLEILKVYPQVLPKSALQDVVRTVFLIPTDANPFYFIKILLAHSGPILKSFVQRLAEDGELKKGSAALFSLFKSLQTANLPMTSEEVWAIINRDPRKYNISYLDPKPLGVGKLAQVHRAQLADGRWVAVRVPKPSAIDLLEPEHRGILNKLLPLMAMRFFPDDNPSVGQAKMVKELHRMKGILSEETQVERTIGNIELAGKTYNATFPNVRTPGGGTIDIHFRVPRWVAPPNEADLTPEERARAEVVVTEIVDHTPVEELIANGYDHTIQAVGLTWYRHFYNQPFIALPMGEVEGDLVLIHVDPHLGNLLISEPQLDPATGRKSLTVNIIDVGLGYRVTRDQAEAMVMFNAGVSIRHAEMIAAGLWAMRDPAQSQSFASEADLLRHIQKWQIEMSQPDEQGRVSEMQPSDYVMELWSNGLMNFPNGLLGMTLATSHMERTVKGLKVPEELVRRADAELIKAGTPLVERLVRSRWPMSGWNAFANTRVLLSARKAAAAETRRRCQLELLQRKRYKPKHG